MFTEIISQLERLRDSFGSAFVDTLQQGFGLCNQLLKHRGQFEIANDGTGAPITPVYQQSNMFSALRVENNMGFIDVAGDINNVHNGVAMHIIGPMIIQAGNARGEVECGVTDGGTSGTNLTPADTTGSTQTVIQVVGAADIMNDLHLGDDLNIDGDANVDGDVNLLGGGNIGPAGQLIIFLGNIQFNGNIKDNDGNDIVILEDIAGFGSCKVLTISCDGVPTFVPKIYFNPSPYLDPTYFTDIIVFGDTPGDNVDGQLEVITLTDSGTVGRGTGHVNDDSAQFNGTDQYFTTPLATALDIGEDFTVTCWVKFDSLGSQEYILQGDISNGQSQIQLYKASDNTFSAAVGEDTGPSLQTADPTGTPSAGEWCFLAMRWNKPNQRISLDWAGSGDSWDDRNYDTSSFGNDPDSSATSLNIGVANQTGSPAYAYYLDGDMDALTFHSRYLTDAELAGMFNHGVGLPYE